MSQNRWQQIEEVFQEALDKTAPEREAFLAARSANDPELKQAVEKLLADYDSAESFIETPAWTDSHFLNSAAKKNLASSLDEKAPEPETDRLIGRRIGVFELVKELGRGGMGAVYLAERADGEFRQKVAIKLIKRGMDTDFIVRRFRHERQILANLDHPNIARLLDGGTTDAGLPYFVMEFIEGEPLYRYCDQKKLDVRRRLKIFQQICSAVEAAHRRQVIHRDIKPGNILVTSFGTPKLLDFGIAKILDPDLIHESLNPTSTMMRLMTLDYASPEQICGGEITPASDVYALGVLLYELLTGHSPYHFVKGRSPHEASRIICEVQPELPSRAVSEPETLIPSYQVNNISLDAAAELRAASPEKLRAELADRLDRVLMKALRKTPADRYRSVSEFSSDIQHFLNGEQVSATVSAHNVAAAETTGEQPASGSEKSLAVLPFKLLNITSGDNTDDRFLGIGLTDALITRLSNIKRFIVRPTSSVLKFGETHYDPFAAGRQLDVQFLLDGHIQKVQKRIRLSVQLLDVAGQTTVWAERFDENFTDVLNLEDVISTKVAEALIPRLSADEREHLAKRGTNNAQAFESFLRGRFHWNTFTEDGFAKAIVAYHEAIAHDPHYAQAFAGIADYYNWLGVFGILPAHECFESAIEAATKAISLDQELSEAHAALGFALIGANFDWEKGELSCRRALELNPNNSTAHVWYSIQLFMEGRFDSGLKHARRGVELDPLSPFNQHNYGWGLYYSRRYEESINEYRKLLKNTDWKYPLAAYGLSWGLRISGQIEEALEINRKALELNPESDFVLSCYAQTLAAAGRAEESKEIIRQLEQANNLRPIPAYHLAIAYCFLHDKENAFDKLEQAFDNQDPWLAWMGVEPVFDFLRDDGRFISLLEQTGNPLFHHEKTVMMEITPNPAAYADSTTVGEKVAPDITNPATHETVPSDTPKNKSFLAGNFSRVGAGLMLLVLGVGALGFLAWRKNWIDVSITKMPAEAGQTVSGVPQKVPGVVSIAVLPLATAEAQSDEEKSLGIGAADLITSKLSRITGINLRSASSVRRYAESPKTPIEIGKELAVDYVVKGSIRRSEAAIEANLEMIDAASGRVVWSQIFGEPTNNLFTLQDSVTELIARTLNLRLTNAEKQNLARHFTESDEAQKLYLNGRYQFGKRSVEGLRLAIASYERAIEMDKNFALAYTGLADCYTLLNWYQEPPPADAWERAKQAALKAVVADEDLADAHTALAIIKFHYERDYKGAEDEFRRALNLKPNYSNAHQWYAFLLAAQGRHNEAVPVMRHAEKLDPRSTAISNAVANTLFYARQYDESIQQARHSLEIDPSSIGAHVILRWNYEKKGMAAEALQILDKEVGFAGDTPTSRAKRVHVFAAIGRSEEAKRILDELFKDNSAAQITPYEIATIYALLDDQPNALLWLKKAKAIHAVGYSFAKVDPLLDNLRENKEFIALLNN